MQSANVLYFHVYLGPARRRAIPPPFAAAAVPDAPRPGREPGGLRRADARAGLPGSEVGYGSGPVQRAQARGSQLKPT